ncbi:exported hypothetical protein [Pseudomonas chlororaphis]
MLLQRTLLFWLCLLPSAVLLAAVQPSLTVYGEAPKYPAGFQHFDYVNPDAPKGGSLRRSSLESGPFDHLIPYIDKGTGVADIDGWLYAPLAYRSKDEPYTVYGLVAEGLELAPDRSWLRFYLNPKARFDDGSPITAQDVRYTFELLMTQGSFKVPPAVRRCRRGAGGVADPGAFCVQEQRQPHLAPGPGVVAGIARALVARPQFRRRWRLRSAAGQRAVPGERGGRRAQRRLRAGQGLVGAGPAGGPWALQLRSAAGGVLRRHRCVAADPQGRRLRLQPRVLCHRLHHRLCRCRPGAGAPGARTPGAGFGPGRPGFHLQPAETAVPGPPGAPGDRHALGFRVEQPADDAQPVPAPAELLFPQRTGGSGAAGR